MKLSKLIFDGSYVLRLLLSVKLSFVEYSLYPASDFRTCQQTAFALRFISNQSGLFWKTYTGSTIITKPADGEFMATFLVNQNHKNNIDKTSSNEERLTSSCQSKYLLEVLGSESYRTIHHSLSIKGLIKLEAEIILGC